MRVLITGGTGHIGQAVAERLLRHGWDVRIFDIKADGPLDQAEYIEGDILNYQSVRDAVHDCQYIVHMAALRSPNTGPAPAVFNINTSGTFNVFEAAAEEGIKRIAQASSINAIGCAWNIKDFEPAYFPVDEDHPRVTYDPYSLTKQLVEDVGDYYWRRDGISSVAFRFPWVYPAEFHQSERFYELRDQMNEALDELIALPEDQRQQKIAQLREQTLRYRGDRMMEWAAAQSGESKRRQPPYEPLWRAYFSDRFNLWVFLDVRDAAQSAEKSLTADFEGSHALFINDDYNWLGYDSKMLANTFFPDVTTWKRDVSGSEALVSIEKARKLIGFEPEYSVYGDDNK